jgi:hypothetical protein
MSDTLHYEFLSDRSTFKLGVQGELINKVNSQFCCLFQPMNDFKSIRMTKP